MLGTQHNAWFHALATLVVVVPEDDGIAVARELADLEWPEAVSVEVTGQPVIYATLLDRLTWFLVVIPPVAGRD